MLEVNSNSENVETKAKKETLHVLSVVIVVF